MLKRWAYRIVLKDLMRLDIYCGNYDAKHGSTEFQYGIWTVMEHIAYMADESKAGDFNEMFSKNMNKSETKVKRTDCAWK